PAGWLDLSRHHLRRDCRRACVFPGGSRHSPRRRRCGPRVPGQIRSTAVRRGLGRDVQRPAPAARRIDGAACHILGPWENSEMSNMTSRPVALVTGAAGFIGAHLTRALLERDRVSVLALDDLSGGFADNLPEEVEFVEGSVTDAALIDRLFRARRIRY